MSSAPKELGKYRLASRIAAGGMAEVYRAKYLGAAGVTKSVVIKRILPAYAGNPAFVRMFVNEAKIAAGLSHGNVAQVFDFGEIDGEFFLAMELVHGQSLARIQRRAAERGLSVPVPIAVYVAMEMCKGLHYAHTRTDDAGRPLGIVHRDVSPQNVLVSYEGQVKIVDFGIAKARDATSDTQAGAVKGKYLYFSPEQARAKEVDAQTDVWATGVVLYELVTGRRPFRGKLIEVLGKIVKGEVVPPSDIDPDLPPALEAVILRALARDKAERYGSCLELQEALAAFLYGYDPRFTGKQLEHLMQHLFGEELDAEGKRIELPRSFLEQLPLWPAKPPPDDEEPSRPGTSETRAERLSSREVRSLGASPPRPAAPPAPRSPGTGRTLLWLAAGTGGAAAAALLALGASPLFRPAPGAGTLQLESEPPGAQVLVDGVPRGSTPAVVEGLEPGVPYALELAYVGREPWRGQVITRSDGPVRLTPTPILKPIEVAPQPEPAPAPSVEAILAELAESGVEPDAELAARAEQRLAGRPLEVGEEVVLELDAVRDAIDLEASTAARVDGLSPDARYELSVEGEGRIGPEASGLFVRSVGFVVQRSPGAAHQGPVSGILAPGDRVAVKGIRRIYAFVLDDVIHDNGGSVVLVVKEPAARKRLVKTVDARENALSLKTRGGRTIAPLTLLVEHELEVESDASFGKTAGPVEGVFFTRRASWGRLVSKIPGDAQTNFAPVGTPTSWYALDALTVALLDPDPTPNRGKVKVRLRAARALTYKDLKQVRARERGR